MATEEYEQKVKINRSLLDNARKCPEFDLVYFQQQLDRLKKEKKMKQQLASVLRNENIEDPEDTAEILFEYMEKNEWLDFKMIEIPNSRDVR